MTQPEPVQPSILPIQPASAANSDGAQPAASFQEPSSSTVLSSIGALKEQYPDLYQKMVAIPFAERVIKKMDRDEKARVRRKKENERQR